MIFNAHIRAKFSENLTFNRYDFSIDISNRISVSDVNATISYFFIVVGSLGGLISA